MGFSRQEYQSGLPCLPLGDLPDPGINPASLKSPALQASSLPLVPPGKLHYTFWLFFIISIPLLIILMWSIILLKVKVKVKLLSHVRLFATPWTVACQAPLSMGFSRQEYWSGLPFPSPGDLPNPGIEPGFPALQADALSSEPPGKPQFSFKTICLKY